MSRDLEEKIRAKNAVVGVIGLGYVGLPLVAGFARGGFRVLGFDIDAAKVDALEAHQFCIGHSALRRRQNDCSSETRVRP